MPEDEDETFSPLPFQRSVSRSAVTILSTTSEHCALCSKCQALFHRMSLPRKTIVEPTSIQDLILNEGDEVQEIPRFNAEHHSVPEVLKMAEAGCLLCGLLKHCVSPEYGEYPLNLVVKAQEHGPWIIKVKWKRTDVGYRESGLDYILVHDSSNFDGHVLTPPIAESSEGETIWGTARKWLKWCAGSEEDSYANCALKRHIDCQSPPRGIEDKRPPRLIYVGKDDSDVRLYITDETTEREGLSYAALTHCWGPKTMPLLTMTTNIDQMICHIPVELLAKTFQDAIIATRKLGIDYLWIDSLCIIQDDTADWMRQSMIMNVIYACCTINIVAADALDWSDGCFLERESDQSLGFKIILPEIKNGQTVTIWNVINASSQDQIARTTTSNRAWCFQETVLSPRSLYFCRDQLLWQCRMVNASEKLWQVTGNLEPSPRSLAVRPRGLNIVEIESIASAWFEYVEEYSRRKLTYLKDRLVAISGIARVVGRQYRFDRYVNDIGQFYMAGIWYWDIEAQLLWYRSGKEIHPKSDDLHAPSWSWASIDGMVKLPNDGDIEEVKFRVLDAQVTYMTEDVYGPVTKGAIRLECYPLRPVVTGEHDVNTLVDEEPCLLDTKDKYYVIFNGAKVHLGVVIFDAGPVEQKTLFALYGSNFEKKDPYTIDWYRSTEYYDVGLLLEPTGTENNFRRVGYFTTTPRCFVDWSKFDWASTDDGGAADKVIIEIT